MFYVRGSDASAEGTHDAHDANGAYRKWGRRDFSPVGDAAARVLPLEQSRGFLVSCGVDGGVLSTPGHSPDSVSVVLDSGDVFVGDLCPSERVALFPNPAYRRSWETLLEHDTDEFGDEDRLETRIREDGAMESLSSSRHILLPYFLAGAAPFFLTPYLERAF